MPNIKIVMTRHMIAILTALLVYQQEKKLDVNLPLGLEFAFSEGNASRLSKKCSRVVKNAMGTHAYPSSPLLKYSDIELHNFSQCCHSASMYDLQSLKLSISQKIEEHFGTNQPLDDSGLVFLFHKIFNSSTPGLVRPLLTEVVSLIVFKLAKVGTVSLPYGVELKIKKNRSSFDLVVSNLEAF
ncbi:hypothetical protein ACA544_01510 [Vibrio cholerae]|uniref:hypothetical protein n=1 Tax=Vibrio cholerae TaxID=666 RepID=UPI000E645EAA|nr:hypothetical protein [Vibrio cholerae]MVC37462.1 hypothetical protein [Vibrio cholerae]TXY77961.1 hypothetical protein FXE80_00985 [Vibrio cholerae]GIB16651.1 hypothetical protein VCSRO90_2778 [Vibrio cholerae]HAS5696751.1 hypothetical protein [Vibrio cholerae]